MQVESNLKFAEDATECLQYHTTVQQDEVSSFTPTVESSATTEVEDAAQGAGGELIVPRLRSLDERSLAVHDTALLNNPDFEHDGSALQIFRDCTQAIEMQQMSRALAKEVLDQPSRKAAWNWNAFESSSVHERADSANDVVTPVSHSELSSSPEPRLATEEYRNSPHSTRRPRMRERSLSPGRNTFLPPDRYKSLPPGRDRSLPHRRERMHYTASGGESSTSETGVYAETSSEMETHSSLRHDVPRQRRAATEGSTLPKRGSGPTARKADRSTVNTGSYRQKYSRYKDEETARYNDQEESDPRRSSYEVDRLANLEELILAQKDEQIRRETAADARSGAEQHVADMEAARIDEEKRAAVEKAKQLLEATQRARESAEQKATEKREELKAALTKTLQQDLKETARELEEARAIAQEKMNVPLIFHDAVGRKFECPWRLCSTWEVVVRQFAQSSHTNCLRESGISSRILAPGWQCSPS